MSSLYEFFATIAPSLDTDADTLMRYADEDEIGGFHPDPAQSKWITGSVFAVEGKALYAIVRALKPKRVIEYGCLHGCSATHLLSALEANGDGELVSIDVSGYAGQPMPEALAARWTFVTGNAVEYMAKNKKRFDLVLEDTSHGYSDIVALLTASLKAKAKVILSHDALHFLVGEAVRSAWNDVIGEGNYETVMLEPSDCGFAYKFTIE